MTTNDAGWIGETFTSDAGWNHLRRLVDIGNRMAGQDGEREGLNATRDALDAVGARDARVERFDLQGWERGDAAVEAGAETVDAIGLPRGPAGEVTAELLDLGAGLPEDFAEADVEGKVVMVSSMVPDYYDRYIHRTEKYHYAVEGGAAGFVYRNHVEGCLPPTGSVRGTDEPIAPVPAVGVSREAGTRLGRRRDGESVTLRVDCETPQTESGNVVAELGPDTDEYVVVSSHVDAHDIAEGARDNGAGTATVVEMAKALAARESDLETRVRVHCYGAEEVGLVGSHRMAAESDLDRVKAVVNVDSNVASRTLRLSTHRFNELEAAAERVADRFDHPVETVPRMVPHSDHWPYVQRGIPGYMVSTDSQGRGRGWGHTYADSLEKLEPRTLREQAILLTELTVDLAREDVSVARQEPGTIAAHLDAENKAEGLQKTSDWPFDDAA
ncbi:MAG: M28 family peptidase [Halolamina sp.]